MSDACMYCGMALGLSERYVVRKARKPPFCRNRWVRIGYSCDSCHDVRREPVTIDPWASANESVNPS